MEKHDDDEPQKDHEPYPWLPSDFWSSRRWLGRLAFPFLIVAFYLGYTGYRAAQAHALSHGRILLYYFAAMLAVVMFIMGIRERHR